MLNASAHVATTPPAAAVTMSDELENSPVAAAKDVISSIFGSAACVYTGQVRFLRRIDLVGYVSTARKLQPRKLQPIRDTDIIPHTQGSQDVITLGWLNVGVPFPHIFY